jgi:hypothetical protein
MNVSIVLLAVESYLQNQNCINTIHFKLLTSSEARIGAGWAQAHPKISKTSYISAN